MEPIIEIPKVKKLKIKINKPKKLKITKKVRRT